MAVYQHIIVLSRKYWHHVVTSVQTIPLSECRTDEPSDPHEIRPTLASLTSSASSFRRTIDVHRKNSIISTLIIHWANTLRKQDGSSISFSTWSQLGSLGFAGSRDFGHCSILAFIGGTGGCGFCYRSIAVLSSFNQAAQGLNESVAFLPLVSL